MSKERCLAINLGLALDGMAVATEIYARARERGLGTWLALCTDRRYTLRARIWTMEKGD